MVFAILQAEGMWMLYELENFPISQFLPGWFANPEIRVCVTHKKNTSKLYVTTF